MPFAITLGLDDFSAASVAAVARPFLERGWGPPASAYPPHVTMAVYAEDAPADRVGEAVEMLASQWEKLPIVLASLGIFRGPPAVLFLAPVVTAALLARREAVRAALPELPDHPHFRPEAWVPHVTLATGGRESDPAFVDLPALPVGALLDRLEIVRFPPAVVLASRRLASG